MAYNPPRPKPEGDPRHAESKYRREYVNTHISRSSLSTATNNEAAEFEGTWPTSFTKGLPHDANGIVDPEAFKMLFAAINTPDLDFKVPMGPKNADEAYRPMGYIDPPGSLSDFLTRPDGNTPKVRKWESPVAGHVYDLEGPDAGSVGMAPAPKLGSDELVAEMAEDYAMALLRDTEFETIRKGEGATKGIIDSLNCLAWFDKNQTPTDSDGGALDAYSNRRRMARLNDGDKLDGGKLFRGSSVGCMQGPYISQFLLVGNSNREGSAKSTTASGEKGYQITQYVAKETLNISGQTASVPAGVADGYVIYGAQRINQRVGAHKKRLDYMTDWASWLDVQNGAGANVAGTDSYETSHLRFITTPRDLATFVHFDALYQAYLNACLYLLAIEADPDASFPDGKKHPTRGAFATFGGPHILTLVTESATRSLKAVRRQKYNHHLRARPEALAAVTALAACANSGALGPAQTKAVAHLNKLMTAQDESGDTLLQKVNTHNGAQNSAPDRDTAVSNGPNIEGKNYLLPMAFPEGSPMHPAYGAGHATVAGSCVTMLKAFFEMYQIPGSWVPLKLNQVGKKDNSGKPPIQRIFVPENDGETLKDIGPADELTLMGELNKLAANVSIGRNMAGVHYYSDYYDSLRMGERIAVGLLQEQMATYPEPVSLRFESFDGDRIEVSTDGRAEGVTLLVGGSDDTEAWWKRHVPEVT